jgi:Carboxypeptidase regulatory-like domain
MRSTTTFKLLAALLVFSSLLPFGLLAQSITTGGVTGTVTDSSSAIMPNINVTLKSNDTGEVLTGTTTSTGAFTFPLLKPGAYTLNVSQSGFRSVTERIEVQLGQTSTANVKLAVGSTSETVEVTGQAPLLQTEDANISTTFDKTQIDQLPSPGGDITNYAQTAPGVVMNSGGSYGNFSAFGLPATSNLFTLNGNDENDPFLNLNNSGSSNLLLGQNEVQEVAVVSNGYTAQYGRQAGVQVDYTTLSGSNALHGDAVFWYNSSMFNANDWFLKRNAISNGQPNVQPFAVNHQWAGSIGGPIKKDKLFFYVDQEGLYYALPSQQTIFLPTPALRSAILTNIGANQPAQLPYYTQLMNLYASSPVTSSTSPMAGSGGCGSFDGTTLAGTLFGTGGSPCAMSGSASGVNHNKEWLLTTRIDYNISNKDKLFGRFKADHGDQPTSTDLILPAVFSTSSNQPEYEGQINETHVFSPNVVNNAILSGLWYTAIFLPDSGQAAVLSNLGYSTVSIGGGASISELGGSSVPDYIFPQGRNSTMAQLTDDFSITKGAHTFKLGINYRRDYFTDFDQQPLTGGLVAFGGLGDFANGTLIGGNGDSLTQRYTTNGDVRVAFYSMGLYFQDEYRVTPHLKLTLALRGDRNSNATCGNNCFSRLNTPFSLMSHDVSTPYNAAITTGLHSAFPNIEKVALQPRIGFTWSLFGHENTVLRGGFGIFADLYQGILMDSVIGNSPRTNTFGILPAAATPLAPSVAGSVSQIGTNANASFLSGFSNGSTLATILAGNPYFVPPGFFSMANQINNPKYAEWNLEIQQAIGPKMSVNLNYVGTHGYNNLVQNPGLNAANLSACYTGSFVPFGQVPAGTFSGVAPGAACSPTGVPLSGTDPRFGAVTELASTGISNYAGLVATFTRRMTHGFQASINYTWSHALDDVTSTNPGTPYSGVSSQLFQLNPYSLSNLNYSSSDSDARHVITANYVWNLPFKSQNKILEQALGGWGLGGTYIFHTGFPYSVASFQTGLVNDGTLPLATYNGGGSINCSVGPGSIATPNYCITNSTTPAAGLFASPNFSGSFSQPNFGNVPRNYFRAPGYFDTDLSVTKTFAVTERAKFEVGGTFFNILNHPNWQVPSNNVASGVPIGQITSLAVQPTTPYGAFQGAGVAGRLIQVHGKIIF